MLVCLVFVLSAEQKLLEANQQQAFNRSVEDFLKWTAGVETLLASEDLGKVSL